MTTAIAVLIGASLVAMTPRPIEICKEGNTGAAQRLAEGVRSAFAQSPNFVLSSGHRQDTLYAYIPAKIKTRNMGARVEYFAQIELSQSSPDSAERLSTPVKVHCWDDDMAACGTMVRAHAETFRIVRSDRRVTTKNRSIFQRFEWELLQ